LRTPSNDADVVAAVDEREQTAAAAAAAVENGSIMIRCRELHKGIVNIDW